MSASSNQNNLHESRNNPILAVQTQNFKSISGCLENHHISVQIEGMPKNSKQPLQLDPDELYT